MMRTSVVVMAFGLLACGGGGEALDLGDRDPRCVSACAPREPSIEGTGAVCDTESQVRCLDECEARIAGTMTTCASCLVEEACLTTSSRCEDVSEPDFCTNEGCTTQGPEGSCSYPPGDQAAYEDCRRQVDPRREVSCTAIFRPSAECAELCDG